MKLNLNPIHWLALCIILSGCATVTLLAASVTATWGTIPGETWDKVRLYRKTVTITGTTTNIAYILLAEVNGTETNWVGTVQAGTVTFVARSVVGTLESTNSNEVTVDLKPAPPSTLKVQ